MNLGIQAKILRTLENYKIRKLGSHQEISVNVRIISATNHNIVEMLRNNTFRKDLYYRLNTLQINVPALKERTEDIQPLLEYYIVFFAKKMNKQIKKIENSVFEYFIEYEFPGNVRELKNIAERAVILCRNEIIDLTLFGEYDTTANNIEKFISEKKLLETDSSVKFNLDEIEKQTILKALNFTKQNKSAAAELLNISRAALLRKIEKHKINANN